MTDSFHTPANAGSAEIEQKRSRFRAFLYPIDSREQALAHRESLRQQHPDANHHCLAYIVGHPERASNAACDDDGEPAGTAARPMLNVLLHNRVGNVAAVVVRHFGGVKLGAGGLCRAYGKAVAQAIKTIPLIEVGIGECWRVELPFQHEQRIRDLLTRAGVTQLQCHYGDGVSLQVCCDRRLIDGLTETIQAETAGQCQFKRAL